MRSHLIGRMGNSRRWGILALGAAGTLGIVLHATPAHAVYVFNETFVSPPMDPGTLGNDWTDGWDNGSNGWEVSEGPGNVANSFYFSQRSDGPLFTGGDQYVGVLRADGSAAVASAIQNLPNDQAYTSGNVTFKVQNMITSWGSDTRFFLVGEQADTSPAYATQIYFGNGTGADDRIYVSQISGAAVDVATASTLTTGNNLPLAWNTAGFNPNAGNYATLSIDFNLTDITVTVSTTNAAGVTSSALPVSFPTDNGVVKFTRAGFFLRQSPNSNGLVWMSDFNLTAVPEPATAGLLMAGALLTMLRRQRRAI